MRMDKKNRKIRPRPARTKASSRIPAFALYLLVGLCLLGLFYLFLYRSHERQLAVLRAEKIREDLDTICAALAVYRQEQGTIPPAGPGLEVLTGKGLKGEASSGEAGRDKPYLDRIPLDPWGSPYVYEVRGGLFAVGTYGSDRRPGGAGSASDTFRQECKITGGGAE
jgi:general secretion pathway protein G